MSILAGIRSAWDGARAKDRERGARIRAWSAERTQRERTQRTAAPVEQVIVRDYHSRRAFERDAQYLATFGYHVASQSQSRQNRQILGVTLAGGNRLTITVTYERVAA